MSSLIKWPIVKLQQLAANKKYAIVGGPFGSNLVSSDYVETGVPVVRGINLPKTERFKCDGLAFVSEAKADALKSNLATPGDLVFTQRGTLGQVGIIPSNTHYDRFVISQSQMKMTVDESKADPAYLYYYFRLKSTVNYIENHALQSGVPHINLGILKKLEVVSPPPQTQRKIAAILSAYDDLIENNKRRITLLEKMAEEVYREWFVRFRFPGYQAVAFEKGIPKGWEESEIKNIVDFKSGFAFKSVNYEIGERYGVVTIKNVHDGKFIPECSDHIAEPPDKLPKHCFIKKGDVLMSLTGNVGRVCIVHGDNLLLNQRVALLKPKQNNQSSFVYWLFRQKSMLTFCEMISTGAAQQNLSPIKLGAQKVIRPDRKIIEKYQKVVEPVMDNIMILLEENGNLNSSKNMLLPRLISGKLSVEDLDIQFPPDMINETEAV